MTVYIHGISLDCALGDTAQTRKEQFIHQTSEISRRSFHPNDPDTVFAFFPTFPAHKFSETSFLMLIEQHIIHAITQAGWSLHALNTLPIFLGSTAYTISFAEQSIHDYSTDGLAKHLSQQSYSLNIVADYFKHKYHNTQVMTFGTACTSSANALVYAQQMLSTAMIDKAIVVGFELASMITLYGFHALDLFEDHHYAPFTEESAGLILGEGIGVLALGTQPADKRIVLAGAHTQCDPYNIVTTVPDGRMVYETMAHALENAAISSQSIRAIKAHATGSPLNDQAEHQAIARLCPDRPIILFKPYIGHTLGACGALECALLVECIDHGFFPALPVTYAQHTMLSSAMMTAPHPVQEGYYLLNYLGFGGNNVSLVLGYNV